MRKLLFVSLVGLSGWSAAQTTTDAWDVTSGTVVTSHSSLDSPGYDIRDIFGMHASSYIPESGNVVFDDDSGDLGYVDFLEWNTPTARKIKSFNLYWEDDFPGNNWRNLAHFTLYGKAKAGDAWSLLASYDTPSQVDRCSIWTPLHGDALQYWRAEFTRGYSSDPGADAPRIVELDGYVEAVPEPASLAVLGVGLGTLLLRKTKRK